MADIQDFFDTARGPLSSLGYKQKNGGLGVVS